MNCWHQGRSRQPRGCEQPTQQSSQSTWSASARRSGNAPKAVDVASIERYANAGVYLTHADAKPSQT